MCFNCPVLDMFYCKSFHVLFDSRLHVNHSWRKTFKAIFPEYENLSEEGVRQRASSVQAHLAGRTCHPIISPAPCRLRDDWRTLRGLIWVPLPEADQLFPSSLALLTIPRHRRTGMQQRELLFEAIFGQWQRIRWMTEWRWLALGEKKDLVVVWFVRAEEGNTAVCVPGTVGK